MSLSDRIEKLFMSVQKPVRYMGGEFNAVMKNPEDVKVRYAFLFPDTYEVGMSHLGMKILYHAINDRPEGLKGVRLEQGLQKVLRRQGMPEPLYP